MTERDIERMAAAGADMPGGLTMPEIMLYQSMRHLYAMFKLGKIGRDAAHAEKVVILKQYADAEQLWRMMMHHRRVMRDLSHISHEITHSGCECCKAVQDALGGVYKHGKPDDKA